MNKNNVIFFTVMFAIIAFMAAMTYVEMEEKSSSAPSVISELPREYEVLERGEAVKITITLGCNDLTIPIRGEEIRMSYYAFSESDNTIFIEDENGNGEWWISTFFADGIRDMEISWKSDSIVAGESIFLPTGEEVTFLGFDPCTGDPRFSVVAES